jgi:hypothetical protein
MFLCAPDYVPENGKYEKPIHTAIHAQTSYHHGVNY